MKWITRVYTADDVAKHVYITECEPSTARLMEWAGFASTLFNIKCITLHKI